MMLGGLCGPCVITGVLESRGPCPVVVGGGGVVMETEVLPGCLQKWRKGAGVKKCRWPPEVSKHKESLSLRASRQERRPADTLVLAQGAHCCTSALQNCKTVNFLSYCICGNLLQQVVQD